MRKQLFGRISKAVLTTGALAGGLLFSTPSVLAQGCALCYNDAAASGSQGITALRHGILVLAIPPMLIFAALFAILYKRRNLAHGVVAAAETSSTRNTAEFVLHLN